MFTVDNLLTKKERRKLIDNNVKIVRQEALRLHQINESVWGGFRARLLKKASLSTREELIAFWNLY